MNSKTKCRVKILIDVDGHKRNSEIGRFETEIALFSECNPFEWPPHPPGSNGSPTKKTMRIEKRWFHVTIVRERSNDYPLFHIVRNRRTLDWLHFDEKSASHATDLNYDCHTSCVSPVMMKGRINSIRCVLRVTNRGRNTLLSFAYFMAEAWRKIRVKLRENLYEVFIRRRFDDVQLCSSLSWKCQIKVKISTIIVSKILFECSILCEQTDVGFWILTWQQYLIYNISRIFVILFVVRSSHNPLKSCLESYARYHCKHFFRVLLHLYIYLKEYERYFLFSFSYFISILNGFQHFYCGL